MHSPVKIYDATTFVEEITLPESAHFVGFSPDDRYLVTGTIMGSLKVWDRSTGRELASTIGFLPSFSDDGKTMVLGSLDGNVRMLDTTTWKTRDVLPAHADSLGWSRVCGAFLLPGSKELVSVAPRSGKIKLWDALTLELKNTVDTGEMMMSMARSPDNRLFAVVDDLQPATKPIAITETREGYDQLLSTLQDLKRRHPQAVFQIRVDEASLYAVNLRTFLYALPFEKTVSIGDCVRNENYRATHFPKRKSDSVDSLSLARFAVLEQPAPSERIPVELCALRDIASRLEAQTREVTRHLNQLHNVLSRVFPELDTIVRELNAKSILELLKKYPTRLRWRERVLPRSKRSPI